MRQDRKPLCQDGASTLAAEILKLAVRDYEAALKAQANGHPRPFTIKGLEEFFLGEYGQFLSNNHGEDIIRKCRDRVGDHTLRLNIDCRGFTDAQKRRLLEDLTAFIAGRYPEAIVVRGGGGRG